MRKIMKKTLAIVLVVVMTVGAAPLSGLVGIELPKFKNSFSGNAEAAIDLVENDEFVYGTNGMITRAEWLHNLAVAFEMTVENDEYPDNYFSDLDITNQYYYDVLLNVHFGVIDVEAGGEVKPDETATREFATHTLNYCLGYQLEDSTYTFSDSSECAYPDDAQIALNRGWVSLEKSKFMPSKAVTSEEVTVMLNDAVAVLGTTVADENYDSEYIINSSYIEIPDGTDVVVDPETSTIMITDSPETISSGDGFVIYQNSIANAFMAESVETNGNITIITYSDVSEDDAYAYVDAQGVVDADFNSIEAYEDTEIVYIDDETGNEYETHEEIVELYALEGTKEFNKTFKASREIDFGSGIKASVSVTMKNPKVVYGIKTFQGEAFAYLEGDVSVSYSIKYDIIADLSKACGLSDIRLVNLTVPGVGGFVISVDISAEGSLSGVNSGTLKTGIQFVDKTLRLIKDFKSKDFTLSLEIKATLGLQAKLGLTDLPVFKGYVYAKIGMTGGMKISAYSGNVTPKQCRHFSAHLYASAGATVSIQILAYKKSHDISHTIFDESNSPIKISHHYEDGRKVYACTHGKGSTEGDNGYRTPSNSKYNDAGWYGNSSSVGYDKGGNPVTLYTYTLDEDNNATITSYTGNATALNIPEKIDGYTVVGIGKNVFEGNTNLRSVVMPNEITTISSGAFSNCYNLSEIILSKNLFEIGSAAFRDCISLKEVFIPKSLEEVGIFYYYEARGPFYGCVNLNVVRFEEGITKIPANLFNSCEGLRSVVITDSVTEIGDSAFIRCENLTSVTIPDSVKRIGSHAFADCSNLSNTNLPKYLVSLGGGAFINCLSLKEVFIPKSLEEVGVFYYYEARGPFYGCVNLNVIKFEENITKIPENIFNSCEGLRTVVIPDSVTEIGDCAFIGCENLTSVTIPNSVKIIGGHSFAECTNLSDIDLPIYLTTIEAGAFKNCKSITKIFIPKSLSSVGTFMYYTPHGPFDGCDSLRNVVFEDGITKIIDDLFNSCEGIVSIDIPKTVVEIGSDSFNNCVNLSNVTFPKGLETIKGYAFQNTALSDIEIPESVSLIGNGVFKGCTQLKTVNIPEGISNIGSSLFEDCSSLKKIVLPSTIEIIYTAAFKNCTSLEEITWNNIVSKIYSEAFVNCDSLVSVIVPSTVTVIGSSAFYDCDALTDVTIPDSVTEIGTSIFYDCDLLKNVSLSKSIKTVPNNSFEHCDVLEEIVIPKGVETIGKNAFRDCVSLKKITIPVTVTSIDSTSLSYPDRTVIYGCKGSYAETYANEYDFKFVDITKHITGLILKDNDDEKIFIDRGYYATPEFEYLPEDTTDIITLTSNDTSIVTVDGNRLYGRKNGSATVTATTTGGLEYTFDVCVHTLSSISVSNQPVKTRYNYGEELDLTGLEITAVYTDDTSSVVSDYTVSGYDPSVYGAQTVTVTYNGKRTTFTVEVIDDRTKLTSIAITTLPDKVAYNKGEPFDSTGMVVTAYYSDGTSAPVTGYTVSAMNSLKTGKQTLTVTYEEFTATFTVTVGMPVVTLSSISVKSNPEKMVYNIGEAFDSKGLVLKAYYSDESTKEITSGYTVSGFDSTTSGVKTVVISYEGKTTTISVIVKATVIKESYTITFNTNGGSYVNPVTAEDGSAINAPANPSKEGNTFVGWTDVNGNMVSVPSTMPSYNMTLYAKWSVNSYSITWVVDGYSTTVSCKYGAAIVKPSDPVKEGFRFVGWTPEVTSTMPANDLVYTAVFESAEVPHEHSYTSYVSKNPTCENDGTRTYICSCGHTFDAIIPALKHNSTKWEVLTEATCTENGVRAEMCAYCSLVLNSVVIPAKGHTKGSWVTSIEPDCINNGEKICRCSICGEVCESEIISATGHTEGEWITVLEPTTETEGKKVKKCTVCGVTLREAAIEKPLKEPVKDSAVVKNPSTTTISYGDSIVLHVDKSKISEGGRVEWTASNGNFSYKADGTTCTISPAKSGDTTFTATIYDANGNAVSTDEQTMTSKAGFFDKIIAFFKKLFGLTKTYPDIFGI